MLVNWEKLKISEVELDKLIKLDLLSLWAIDLSYVFLLNRRIYRKSLLITESVCLCLMLFLLFPITLIVFRALNWLSNDFNGLILVLLITLLLSLGCLLIINYYLWDKAKKLKYTAILLDKIKQYNNLINNLKIITQLKLIDPFITKKDNQKIQQELETALNLTKTSLLKSIEIETIINRLGTINLETNYKNANNRYQLLANLESGLVNLELLTQYDADDYQQLLSEVIEIGLSVHKEIRKTQIKLNQSDN
ncbi:hypothetical protein NIES4102_35730 [Chondrocystis sp. NIES-4102]|nr:hypothetical protein NIES4102_35730 [Chondrocystis sp. NIES-4102]